MKRVWHHTKKASKHVAKKTGHLFFPWVMHYLTDKYQNKHHHLVVDTIFAITAITLIAINVGLGYWFYQATTPADLHVTLDTPAYVISGSEIIYYIDYHNTTKDIENVSFELITPDSFSCSENNCQSINKGDVQKYDFGEIKVKGEIIGSIDEIQKIAVVTKYTYHGQNFSEVTFHSYKINDTSFEVVTNMPETILNNQEFTWSVHYKNNSDSIRENVTFDLDLPSTIKITASPKNYEKKSKQVTLKKVEARQEGDLEFRGVFSKAQGESSTLIGVSTNLDSYVQSDMQNSIDVLTPRLSISSSMSSVGNIGESINYQITCNNIGDAELTNLTITADISNGNKSGFGFYASSGSVSGDQAIWTINSLLPGNSKTVTLTIAAPENLREKNLSLSVSSQAKANIADASVVTHTEISSASTKYNSTLDFDAQGKYYGPSGEQLGYGPYPLEADELTSLRVFWNVRDFTNDLHNVTIKTTLPSQVQWTGSSSVSQGANISYNSASREVTWHTGNIPAFAGPQGASFEVRITPNFQQIGSKINITNQTLFSAQDSHTNTIIHRNLGSLQTSDTIK